jgi:glycosyltransferase involved in cell wall biosynthesis
MKLLTIIIPCFEKSSLVEESIEKNFEILDKYPLVIINKSGGEKFKLFRDVLFFDQNSSFWFARRFAVEFVKTKYILNLDVDTILPPKYIEKAIEVLEEHPDTLVVAIDYEEQQGHLSFGTSIWRTEQFKDLYDWHPALPLCECKWMWEKVNGKVETLPMKAKHLKVKE